MIDYQPGGTRMQDRRQLPPVRPDRARGYPFSPPGPAEREALGRVSTYLRRAGNEVESRSMLPTGPPHADLRALRESLRAAAALCDGMVEMASGGAVVAQPAQPAPPTPPAHSGQPARTREETG